MCTATEPGAESDFMSGGEHLPVPLIVLLMLGHGESIYARLTPRGHGSVWWF